MKITNQTELRTFLKGFYDQHVTALNGILDKLPDSLKADLSKLRDGLNEQLTKLPPLDQAPAAQEAGWALNSFADAMVRMQEYATGLMDRLTAMKGELTAKATAFNGLQDQITRGELLSKDKATEACALARADGIKSLQPELRATRKSALELASLPVPGDAILDLPAAEYEPRVTAARDQVAKLGAKGLKLGGKGSAWVSQLAWASATEFAGQLTALDEVLGTAPAKPAGDPLLGRAPDADSQAAKAPRLTLA